MTVDLDEDGSDEDSATAVPVPSALVSEALGGDGNASPFYLSLSSALAKESMPMLINVACVFVVAFFLAIIWRLCRRRRSRSCRVSDRQIATAVTTNGSSNVASPESGCFRFPGAVPLRAGSKDMDWWQEVVGRCYGVDFEPGVPPSETPRPLPQLRALLDAVASSLASDYLAEGISETIDDIAIARALIANDFDATRTGERLVGYRDWRQLHPGLTVPSPSWVDNAISIVPFEDKCGRPVVVSRLRSLDTNMVGFIDMMTNGYRATADGCIAHMLRKRGAKISPSNPLEQWILVIDFDGTGWHNFSMDCVKMFMRESTERYLERIAGMYLLNTPRSWVAMWGLLQRVLHPRTKRKIKVIPTADVHAVMRDLVGDVKLLPAEYGGSATSYPPPGQGSTLDEKVGAILADSWRRSGVPYTDKPNGLSQKSVDLEKPAAPPNKPVQVESYFSW